MRIADEAAITWPVRVPSGKGADLAMKLRDGGRHQRHPGAGRGVGHDEPGREIVAPVDDQVDAVEQRRDTVRSHPLDPRIERDMGIERARPFRRDRRLGAADVGGGEQRLALQVGKRDDIVIDDPHHPHPGGGERGNDRAADPARADHQQTRRLQPHLPRTAHFAQHDVAGVAVEFGVGEHKRAIAAFAAQRDW